MTPTTTTEEFLARLRARIDDAGLTHEDATLAHRVLDLVVEGFAAGWLARDTLTAAQAAQREQGGTDPAGLAAWLETRRHAWEEAL